MIAAIITLAVAYLAFHYRHYRQHRRAGLTIRESIPGPFRTWFTVSRRIRVRSVALCLLLLVALAFLAGHALRI